jgi:hypothetical protein
MIHHFAFTHHARLCARSSGIMQFLPHRSAVLCPQRNAEELSTPCGPVGSEVVGGGQVVAALDGKGQHAVRRGAAARCAGSSDRSVERFAACFVDRARARPKHTFEVVVSRTHACRLLRGGPSSGRDGLNGPAPGILRCCRSLPSSLGAAHACVPAISPRPAPCSQEASARMGSRSVSARSIASAMKAMSASLRCGYMGNERICSAARSATGNEGTSALANAGCR